MLTSMPLSYYKNKRNLFTMPCTLTVLVCYAVGYQFEHNLSGNLIKKIYIKLMTFSVQNTKISPYTH